MTKKLSFNQKLVEEQNKTLADLWGKLEETGKCIFIRPTGFGKTYLLMEKIAKKYAVENRGKMILYMYPINIIVTEIRAKGYIDGKVLKEAKFSDKAELYKEGNFMFVSYSLMTLRYNTNPNYWTEFIKNNNVGLIILDEAHRAGSESFYTIYDTFEEMVGPAKEQLKVVGATATPDRPDEIEGSDDRENIVKHIFEGSVTYEYGLASAIEDEIILKPVFRIGRTGRAKRAELLRERAKKRFGESFDAEAFNRALARSWEGSSDDAKMIADALVEAGYSMVTDKYYKFIVFCGEISDMTDRATELTKLMHSVFNDILVTDYGLKRKFNIRETFVISSDGDGSVTDYSNSAEDCRVFDRTEKLEELTPPDSNVPTVDVVYTRDMVNMGYHVSNITGVIMLRATESSIVFFQQLGRSLSVQAEHRAVVIDFVANTDKFIIDNVEKEEEARRNVNDTTSISTGTGTGSSENRKLKEILYRGLDDKFSLFEKQWQGKDNPANRLLAEYLYTDRMMPIYVAAAYMRIPCKTFVGLLMKNKIEIRTEDEQYILMEGMCDCEVDRLKEIADDIKKNAGTSRERIYRERLSAAKEVYNLNRGLIKMINCKECTPEGKSKYVTKSEKSNMYYMMNRGK